MLITFDSGYMAPEYAMEGLFSAKSDVFSFGVIVLEIISGKKNSGFDLAKHVILLNYAPDQTNLHFSSFKIPIKFNENEILTILQLNHRHGCCGRNVKK